MSEDLRRVVEALRAAEGLVVTAGAGMGVDSGLPDFRGDQGFWRAYPPYARLGLGFSNLANPRWFREDPALAWGFYGHRLELYRRTVPHGGFGLLLRWGEGMRLGSFVFTSNVDGQFQRAGFDPGRIYECHGAIEFLQCLAGCGVGIFPADGVSVEVDAETFRAREPLPSCPRCGSMARPNILMFGDGGWDEARAEEQEQRLARWLAEARGARLVVIECGAGTAIPSVRSFGERLVGNFPGALLVRINPREPQVPQGHVGVASGALAALQAIEALR
jgi:NAD-dependent SIR2 family protein deacetylase